MRLISTRFGDIEIEESKALVFPRGLIGFPDNRRFVLLYPGGRGRVAWLQSIEVPGLAFPVIEGATFGAGYPDPSPTLLAQEAGLGTTELAILVVVAVQKGSGLIANQLAPLVVDMETRTGAQLVLDPRRYSASTRVGTGRASAQMSATQ